jgi:serine/threonine-protein kinase
MGLDYDFVKVLDFGLAKHRRSNPEERTMQTTDHTTGTPAYMAPEAILGGAAVDRRADIYSLGCVAYFLLTGALVFQADTHMKTLIQHVQDAPVPPSERTELPVPKEIDDLVLSCLEKDPARRPRDTQEVLTLLQQCRLREPWNRVRAREWWETHLPELCLPRSADHEYIRK